MVFGHEMGPFVQSWLAVWGFGIIWQAIEVAELAFEVCHDAGFNKDEVVLAPINNIMKSRVSKSEAFRRWEKGGVGMKWLPEATHVLFR